MTTRESIDRLIVLRNKGRALVTSGDSGGWESPSLRGIMLVRLEIVDRAIAELEAIDSTPGIRQFGQGLA